MIEISTGKVRCFSCGEYVTPTGRAKVLSDLAKKYKEMKK
jgi:DNA-directed RNA polymerase subunit N (RpoN/RPB10)